MNTEQIIEGVKEVVAQVLEIEEDEISENQSIVNDLEADSLDLVDLSYSLGKKFNIKMPQSSLISQAIEVLGENCIIENDQLTALGAAILQAGPNKYTAEEAYPGQTLLAVFSDTKIKHWANLCEKILSTGKTGDELFAETVKTASLKVA